MTQLKDIASIHAPAGAETHPEAQLDRAAEEDEASASAVVVLEDCLMTLQYTVVILYSKLSNHLIHAPYRAVGMALEAMYEHAKMNLDKWQLIADYKAELDQFRMAQKTQPQRDDRERIAQNQRINRLAGQVKAIGLNPLSAMQKK